ncbi:Na+/H+ antiporter subunit G [Marinomonas fungiae]|uniref:Multisubunit potassium/proton antiporter, PhaG subunit (TC 2.A.63.1.1) n=1 Tax=Marinomonas fungiae TaxID=1137284 RepID=A0A0K6IQM0_9GAMM|nr:Na+/H+ antiporter subunit G [Marinomonas fungiae]CUB05582.1 multisubunit potassium/proton antiporter, PhaG subunit (TC 2.A.63.1.1) [Marinomonas fungiae]
MSFYTELLICVLLVIGGIFLLIGSIGLARLPDVFTRLHGPTKATTLGITGVLLASMIYQTLNQGHFSVSELLITLFLLITAPVAANMIAKTALHRENSAIPRTTGLSLLNNIRQRKAADAKEED